jgi:hypothetical protein
MHSYLRIFKDLSILIVIYIKVGAKTRFQARGEAELVSWSAVKYLPYDICIRFFGWPNVLFCTFAELFDIHSCQLDRYDYLLVN